MKFLYPMSELINYAERGMLEWMSASNLEGLVFSIKYLYVVRIVVKTNIEITIIEEGNLPTFVLWSQSSVYSSDLMIDTSSLVSSLNNFP